MSADQMSECYIQRFSWFVWCICFCDCSMQVSASPYFGQCGGGRPVRPYMDPLVHLTCYLMSGSLTYWLFCLQSCRRKRCSGRRRVRCTSVAALWSGAFTRWMDTSSWRRSSNSRRSVPSVESSYGLYSLWYYAVRFTLTEMGITVNGKILVLLTETETKRKRKNYEKRKRNGNGKIWNRNW